MLGCKWESLFAVPIFIACVPDRTLSGLPSPRPAVWFSSRLESRPPKTEGDGCRRIDRSPEFSATRLWRRLTAKPPGFRFPPESAALPQPCRCSAASIVLPSPIPPVCTARIPGGTFLPTLHRCASSNLTTVYRKLRAGAIHPHRVLVGTVHKCCAGILFNHTKMKKFCIRAGQNRVFAAYQVREKFF